ncbi:MAG: 1-deoxy-D-xylulose-5-phosphate synthase [Eubacteriales bacterium]|nr:1-deoxy-D-xylulose-5-phosphate synthase [Eubacteriales bacterium]
MRLEDIHSPEDLKLVPVEELENLALQIRQTIMQTVADNGGHLSSNLGVVELTIALHRVFDSPKDKIIFDVGHQCYAHKLLTGRNKDFCTLRRFGGISGFPKKEESDHDIYETGHASTALSAALGLARARDLKKEDYHVVVVVGDGALTGGMCYEALNDAGNRKTPLIVILNDNQMSISPNVGALNNYLSRMRLSKPYLSAKKGVSFVLSNIPFVGKRLYKRVQSFKNHIKNLFIKESYFTSLGFTYLGPIDGHDEQAIEELLSKAKRKKEPVLLHIVTTKGAGYGPAEAAPDRMHGTPPFSLKDGCAKHKQSPPSFSKALGEKLVELAEKDNRVVGISAAMMDSTGIGALYEKYPERAFDVGIAEEHAAVLAAGLATGGLKPYLAVYDTFMQRAMDQLIVDIALQNLPVTMCLDRGGIGGEDGPTHHGVFGTALFRAVPNTVLLAPRSVEEFKQMLDYSLKANQPVIIRYAKAEGKLQQELPKPVFKVGNWENLKTGKDLMFISYGRMVDECLAACTLLKDKGIDAGVINASSLKPLDLKIIKNISESNIPYIVVEEVQLQGGLGSAIAEMSVKENFVKPLDIFALPDSFTKHGDRASLLKQLGLDCKSIAERAAKLYGEKHA